MATVGKVKRSREHEADPRLHLVSLLICEPILPHSRILPYSLVISQSDLFYLFIVRVEGYCFTWSHSVTHTHTHTLTLCRASLDEWSARRRDLYLTTHDTHNRQTSMPPAGIKPAVLKKLVAAELRLRPRGTRDWLPTYCEADLSTGTALCREIVVWQLLLVTSYRLA